MTDNATFESRRRKLIETLRAGTYAPAQFALFTYRTGAESTPAGHCCLGVGIRIKIEAENNLSFDDVDYEDFRTYYGVSEDENIITGYMIGMNDGTDVVARYPTQPKRVRARGHTRSHAFIARWLEIVWGLTPNV